MKFTPMKFRLRKKHLEYAAHFSEIISAIAVVITVIYLTMQIKDNTKALKNQGHFNALTLTQSPVTMTVNNKDLAAIVYKGYTTPDSLNPVERLRFYDHVFLSFNGWEYLYYAHQTESIPISLWLGADAYYGDLIDNKPGIHLFWKEYQNAFAEPFFSYADKHFKDTIEKKPIEN